MCAHNISRQCKIRLSLQFKLDTSSYASCPRGCAVEQLTCTTPEVAALSGGDEGTPVAVQILQKHLGIFRVKSAIER